MGGGGETPQSLGFQPSVSLVRPGLVLLHITLVAKLVEGCVAEDEML